MQESFQKHITAEFPELLTKPFIIAISGGIDSMVLAQLCFNLKLDFALAHCNFQLRGEESEKDSTFVQDFANSISKPLFLNRFNTEEIAEKTKNSIQLTARKLRYDWFLELISTTEYNYLLTAHHLNDNLETFIINLSRTTGIKGLTGIPKQNEYIRRPLLKFTKENIKNFAITHKISWREDESNASTKYLRNKIRHRIIPELMALNPKFLENFDTTLERLNKTESLVNEYIQLIYSKIATENGEELEIDIKKLLEFQNPKTILYQMLSVYNFTEWNDVLNLLYSQTGKRVESTTHLLIKDRQKLVVSPLKDHTFAPLTIQEHSQLIKTENFELKLEEVEELGEFRNDIAYVDKKKLKFPLSLRQIQNGDYFYPFGMKGKKKLSDFLKDEKVSPHHKSDQLVLCNANKELIWVLYLRIDNRYKVEKSTTQILKIEIIK